MDGFFHACDRPIEISKLRSFTDAARLQLLSFGHAWHSQPNGFSAALKSASAPPTLIERYAALDSWSRLAVLDDLRELAVNPVFWLAPNPLAVKTGIPAKYERNPVLNRTPSWRRIAAPLAPTRCGELTRTLRLRDLAPQQKDLSDYFEAGWLLGNDGTLPASLLANRCGPSTGARLGNTKFHLGTPDKLNLSAPQQKILSGLRAAVAGLDPENEISPQSLLNLLTAVLEPRVDRPGPHGRELPQLSSGDLLRLLRTRGVSDEKIVELLR